MPGPYPHDNIAMNTPELAHLAGEKFGGASLSAPVSQEMRQLAWEIGIRDGSDAWVLKHAERGDTTAVDELDQRTRPSWNDDQYLLVLIEQGNLCALDALEHRTRPQAAGTGHTVAARARACQSTP